VREDNLSPLEALAAARDARAAADAVEALRAALWERMLAALREPRAEEVAELAERLSRLCAALLSASLAGAPAPLEGERAELGALRATAIIDDSAAAPPRGDRVAAAARTAQRARRVQEPALAQPAGTGEISMRDERAREGAPGAWLAAIARQLRRYEEDRRPFAVLLLETLDLDAVRARLAGDELQRLSNILERGLAVALAAERRLRGVEAHDGSLQPIAERAGRFWVIAPRTDQAGGRTLAARIAEQVTLDVPAGAWRVQLLAGVAVCPANARTPSSLVAYADVDLYAARAALPAHAAAPVGSWL